MRRIVMFNWVSIDGFFAGPNGEIDWILRDPQVDQALRESGTDDEHTILGGSDTMLLGNTTYTMFENSWPQMAKDPSASEAIHKMADEVNRMNKVVFSRSRQAAPWENSRLLRGNLIEEVGALKQGKGTSILIFGSGTIVQQLTNAGLIDEYFIAVTPVVLGKGKQLFSEVQKRNLQLKQSRQFESGNVLLRYS